MKFDYTGRHIEVTPAMREFTEDKLRKLERLLEGPLDVHVVLGIEKHRHVAEIQVKSRTTVLSGARETSDLYVSIGEVAEKLERQALKHKEKLHDHKRGKGPRDPESAASIEAAAVASEGAALDTAIPQVRRIREVSVKPMATEDALLEMEAGDHDVLVYRDAATERVHVLCRQRDGDFLLVEPDL